MANRRRIAWSVGLGVLSTVVVAWVFANINTSTGGFISRSSNLARAERRATEAPNTSPNQTPTLEALRITLTGRTEWRARTGVRGESLRDFVPTFESPEALVPAWIIRELLDATSWRDRRSVHLNVRHSGWPLPALSDVDGPRDESGPFSRRGTFVIREELYTNRGLSDHTAILLPYLPVWPGLLADTLFYAAAWWLLITLPLAARNRYRTRRGRCPTCGYALAGLPPGSMCPECGPAQ